MKKWFKFQKIQGFSLVEVSIAIALVSIVALAVFELSGLNSKDSRFMSLSRVAVDHRNRIVTNIKNPVSWQNTSSNNSSFDCFAAGSRCDINSAAGSSGYYDFVVYGPDSSALEKLTYDRTDATSRISLSSVQCGAGVSNPNKDCPLKYQARWKPICQTYPCANAQLEIKVDLIYDFPTDVPLNTNKYAVKIIRDFRDSSIEAACAALNGVFNTTTGLCTPRHANQSCPAYQVVTAINSNGTIVCKPLYTGQCIAATQLVSGVRSSGGVQCAPRPVCP